MFKGRADERNGQDVEWLAAQGLEALAVLIGGKSPIEDRRR